MLSNNTHNMQYKTFRKDSIAVGDIFIMYSGDKLYKCDKIDGNIMLYSRITTPFLKRIGNFIKNLINSKHKSIL